MLDLKISDFIHYCQVSNFSKKSIKSDYCILIVVSIINEIKHWIPLV
jgi:hypothetical protein